MQELAPHEADDERKEHGEEEDEAEDRQEAAQPAAARTALAPVDEYSMKRAARECARANQACGMHFKSVLGHEQAGYATHQPALKVKVISIYLAGAFRGVRRRSKG